MEAVKSNRPYTEFKGNVVSDFNLRDESDGIELDDLFNVNDDPFAIDPDSRDPVEAMLDGALNQLKDREAQADIGRIILDNALPSGYRIAKNTGETIIKDLNSLYNDTAKRLKDPVNKIRKDTARIIKERNVESLFGIKQDRLLEMLTPKEEKARVSLTSGNIQDNAVESMLNSIFTRDEANRREDLAIAEAESTTRARLDEASNAELRRITSFQDTIQYDWMRKTLELQQRAFYLQQEQLGVAKAAGIDTKSALDAIVKNTSLPDYVKSNLTEDYQEEAMSKIYGGITGRMSDFSKGFGSRLRERIKGRGNDLVDTLESIFNPLSELSGELADVDESVSIGEILGGVGTSMAAESSAGTLGMLIRKVIRDNPTLSKFNEELMFYAENFPQELTEALESWNGGFSEDLVKRFPFLAQIRSATLADELRALIPPIEDVIIGVNQNLEGDGANISRPFDEITRRSVIEIIPGFLSRILEQVTIANFGPDSERIVYDINSEMFKTQKEAADMALRRVQGSVGMTDRMNVLAVRDMFNKGKFVSDDIAEMLVQVSKELREEGREMNREEVLDRLLDKGEIRMIGRVGNLFDNSGLDESEIAEQIRKLAMNQDVGARKELITQEVTNRINSTRLSPEALIAFEDWFTSYARLNLRPKKENMAKDLADLDVDENTIAEMVNFISESKLSSRQIDRELAKGSRGVGDGFFGMQEEIRRMYEAGQKDLLDAMGVTTINETNDNVVNEMLYGRFSREDFLANLEENRTVSQSPRVNINDLASQLDEQVEQSTPSAMSTTMDMTGLNIPQPTDLWNAFSITLNEMTGVPVHILSDAGNRAPEPGQNNMSHDQRMYELVERGFGVTGELLDGILRKDLTVEVEQTGLISQIIKGTSNVTSAGLGFLGDYTRGVFNMGNALVGAGGRVVGGGLSGIGNVIGGGLNLASSPFRKNDIYVEGDPDPVISARDLRKGRLIDVNSGKPVKTIKDITGRVEDAEGNVILTEEQLESGIYDRAGNNLTALTGFIGSAFRGFTDLWKWQTTTAIDLAKTVLGAPLKAVGMLKRAKDVYVSDDMTYPKLRAQVMKNGGYISEQGTPIQYPSDIDGQVRDLSGNIVLTHDDILKGLVYVDGTPIDANKAWQVAKKAKDLLWGAGKAIWNANVAITKTGLELGTGVLKTGANVIGGVFGSRGAAREAAIDEISKMTEGMAEGATRSDAFLEGILTFMMARWPMEEAGMSEELVAEQTRLLQEMVASNKNSFNDRDGDGDRDNSLSDILSRRNSNLDSDQTKQKVEKAEKESRDPALFGLIGGIASALGTAVTTLGGMSQTLMGILGAAKAGSFAGDLIDGFGDGEDVDRRRRGGGRRGGRAPRGRIGARGLMRSGTRAALAVGGRQLAKRGALAAVGAVAGTTLAPIIAGAGLLWGAWEIGNYFWEKSEAEPIEKLRFMQYGLDPNNETHRALIRQTESELEDEITTSRNKASVSVSSEWVAENIFDIWGIDPSDNVAATDFLSWFKNRCLPVFSRHVAIAYSIDKGIDVTDIDDEIDEEDVVKFLNGIKTFPGIPDPLLQMSIPSMAVTRLLSKEEIKLYHDGLLAKYGVDPKTDKENTQAVKNIEENAKSIAAGHMAAQSTASAYERLAEERRKEAFNSVSVKDSNSKTASQRARDLESIAARAAAANAAGVAETNDLKEADKKSTERLRLIKPCMGRLTSPYGYRKVNGVQKMHKGVDWADYEGSPIVAAADGVIKRWATSDSYGKCVYIEHANGWVSRYAHLYSHAPGLGLNDVVKQGQLIGTMGNTGNSRGVHLHFELREGFGNEYQHHDPLKFIVNSEDDEKEIKSREADAKQEAKESKDDTIEGIDTLETDATGNTVIPETSEADILAPSKPTSQQAIASKEKEVERAQREASNSTLNEIVKVSTSGAEESVKQTKLLTAIAKNTDATVKALEMLAKELNKKKDDGFSSPSSAPPAKQTQAAPISSGNIKSIVNMDN